MMSSCKAVACVSWHTLKTWYLVVAGGAVCEDWLPGGTGHQPTHEGHPGRLAHPGAPQVPSAPGDALHDNSRAGPLPTGMLSTHFWRIL